MVWATLFTKYQIFASGKCFNSSFFCDYVITFASAISRNWCNIETIWNHCLESRLWPFIGDITDDLWLAWKVKPTKSFSGLAFLTFQSHPNSRKLQGDAPPFLGQGAPARGLRHCAPLTPTTSSIVATKLQSHFCETYSECSPLALTYTLNRLVKLRMDLAIALRAPLAIAPNIFPWCPYHFLLSPYVTLP